MKDNPLPLFNTYKQFLQLDFQELVKEHKLVRDYVLAFPADLKAVDGYLAVRSFLKLYANNGATFNSYRTQVERMLLWTLLIARKPLFKMRRQDAESFMDFCLNPPRDWVSPTKMTRFIRKEGAYIFNIDWRPFTINVPKRERSLISFTDRNSRPYQMSKASVAQVFAVCSSFFQNAIDKGSCDVNPFRKIKQKEVYKQTPFVDVAGRSLTPLQWSYVLKTAEQMADENPKHERTLFILATIFCMYLRVSDLAGHDNWQPTMGDFRNDASGNWWFHVLDKCNKPTEISVRDEYVEAYLTRYRRHLGLPPLPSPHEMHPLLTTLSGRSGLTDRAIQGLLQEVFNRSLARMLKEGFSNDEVDQLRSASLYWLRHTSAKFDAQHRDVKELQADLRHNSMNTTQSTYYNFPDEPRVNSAKHLPIKR
ncbi:site-specific integrase [Pseudomonas oryzae]|uniref:Site-specific recombinase XerD n=1 Tax=Pseudomonas oryzae TaxID=1392877 RepID=A0A1H1QCN2_9PSED|nr:site-specific integrase [Pseudomonas oryzae]SDS21252.1 Site-specific recombinase XerD [Pseudomonas oryzae]